MMSSIIQSYVALGLIIAIFVAAPSWPCHDQWSIVIFGGKLSSTGRGRMLWIAGITITLFVYTAMLGLGYTPLIWPRAKRGKSALSSGVHASGKLPQPVTSATAAGRHGSKTRRTPEIGSTNINGNVLFVTLVILIVSTVAITNTELLRVQNGVYDTDADWGFGQMLAIALVLLPAWRAGLIYWELGLQHVPWKGRRTLVPASTWTMFSVQATVLPRGRRFVR
jgi:hypothetical protein